MNEHEVVKYVNPKDCYKRIRLMPTESQVNHLVESARATNMMFLRLLNICELIDNKYRLHHNRSANDMYLCGKIADLKKEDSRLKGAWSSSQKRLVIKVLQRNHDRQEHMRELDHKAERNHGLPKMRYVQFLSTKYPNPYTCDMTGFQIPIDLNPIYYDITAFNTTEYKKGMIKIGKKPALILTIEGPKLYVPKLDTGIKLKKNGLKDLSFLCEVENGELFAYIEEINGGFYLTFYERYANYFMSVARMPKYVKEIQAARRVELDFPVKRDTHKKKSDKKKNKLIKDLEPEIPTLNRGVVGDALLDEAFSHNKNVVEVDKPKPVKKLPRTKFEYGPRRTGSCLETEIDGFSIPTSSYGRYVDGYPEEMWEITPMGERNLTWKRKAYSDYMQFRRYVDGEARFDSPEDPFSGRIIDYNGTSIVLK